MFATELLNQYIEGRGVSRRAETLQPFKVPRKSEISIYGWLAKSKC